MFAGLITIAGGILAASGLIIGRKPNAKELIDKLTPYQGWIGTVMFIWGLYEMFAVVTNLGVLKVAPLHFIFWTATGVADLVVGFLLGFGMITKYALGKNPVALARGQQIRQKLAVYQGAFGALAVVMGALYIVL